MRGLPVFDNTVSEIQKARQEISQSRSKYQLEKFVIGQHHSQEMQYYQLVIEADGVINSIKESELKVKKLRAEAEELRETGKKSDSIEAELKELSITSLATHITGSKRELVYLHQLFSDYPKFTRDEIEIAQADYWETRLVRTAQLQMLSRQGGVDWAQLEALQQANIIEEGLLAIPSFNHINDQHNKLQIGEKND